MMNHSTTEGVIFSASQTPDCPQAELEFLQICNPLQRTLHCSAVGPLPCGQVSERLGRLDRAQCRLPPQRVCAFRISDLYLRLKHPGNVIWNGSTDTCECDHQVDRYMVHVRLHVQVLYRRSLFLRCQNQMRNRKVRGCPWLSVSGLPGTPRPRHTHPYTRTHTHTHAAGVGAVQVGV